jgi:hypothetical protein
MATTIWYVRAAGNDKNSGGHDSDTARVTRDSGTPGTVAGTTFTDAGGDFVNLGVLAGDAINIQVAGVSSIYEIASRDSATQLTLVSAPANASYNYRIGGARAAVKKTVQGGAGENIALSSGDTVWAQGGSTFTENAITILAGVTLRGNGSLVTIDGTGGAGGSDVLTYNGATIQDVVVANAVDQGIVRSGGGGGVMQNVRAQSCGGKGIEIATHAAFCSARSCVGDGITTLIAGCSAYACEAVDGTADGFKSAVNTWFKAVMCLAYDNGGDGCETSPNSLGSIFINCTFEGNTGAGLVLTAQAAPTTGGAVFVNNLFTNNGTYGVNASAAQTSPGILCDYNLYFGNTTAPRNNFITGTNDKSTDPQYTAPASDDYSIKFLGGAFKAGFPVFKNPTLNKLNIGAIPGPGSGEQAGDYPAAGDVRSGTSYANGTLTGTLVSAGAFLGWPLG